MVARIKLDAAPVAKIYLAEWRRTKFASQEELAAAMNTTAAAVSRIETGKREWSKGYLEALAYLVGCQVHDLFRKPYTAHNKPNLSELMRIASNLSEHQLRHLIGLLDRDIVSGPPEEPAVEYPLAPRAKAKPA